MALVAGRGLRDDRIVRVLAAVSIMWMGCYAPHPQPGAPCADGVCPVGLVCSPATQTCELHAIDARLPDVPAPDAARDAPVDASLDAAAPDAPPAGPRLVQQATGNDVGVTTLSVTLPAAPASGDLLVMIGGDPHGPLDGVTGGGVTWTLATSSLVNMNVEIWYGITDGSSSTVTITYASQTGPMTMSVSEWANVAAPDPLDAAHAADGMTSPASAGSITTGGPDLVLFAVADLTGNTFGDPGVRGPR